MNNDRSNMDVEMERCFVENLFNKIENEGLVDNYIVSHFIGEDESEPVYRRLSEEDGISLDVLPMWLVLTNDEKEVYVTYEEIMELNDN